MAFIVARPNGTWEARESFRTDSGPRSRTLASFRELTPEVERKIGARASGPIDFEALRGRASRAGAPVGSESDRLVAELLRRVSQGDRPSRRLTSLLAADLGTDDGLSHELERMKAWVGATYRDRGEALVDLLGVGDALPDRGRSGRKQVFPRISSVP